MSNIFPVNWLPDIFNSKVILSVFVSVPNRDLNKSNIFPVNWLPGIFNSKVILSVFVSVPNRDLNMSNIFPVNWLPGFCVLHCKAFCRLWGK